MKKLFVSYSKLLLMIVAIFSLTTSCNEEEFYYDNTPPSPPQNVFTYAGDGRVDIIWDHNFERDVAGYNVYFNYTYQGRYTLIGSTTDDYFIDFDVSNGESYYYGVAAYDFNGNESELSYDMAVGTPRPEGFNQAVFDYLAYPTISGYSFDDYSVVAYNDDDADLFFENYNGTFYVNVWDDTDIQDMGYTDDIYEILYAPSSGWVPLVPGENVKYVEVEIGHTYVIWTWDNHFAKIRISTITNERMVFDWAYQLQAGNPQLKTGTSTLQRIIPDQIIKGR